MPRLWDDSLYSGAAEFYAMGRLPYPQRLGDVIAEHLGLTGTERLLDLGCGPGSLTLLLAPRVGQILGVDADPDMLRVGEKRARELGIANVTWRHAYAEDLEMGADVDVLSLAQSFHWMNRDLVAKRLRGWLAPSGSVVHVGATTHEGTGADGLEYPAPPRALIQQLVEAFLGPDRRAGMTIVLGGQTAAGEEVAFAEAGFAGPHTIPVPGGDVVTRSAKQVLASVLSLSSSTPALFGEQLAAFVHQVELLLKATSPSGLFSEQLRDMRVRIWTPQRA